MLTQRKINLKAFLITIILVTINLACTKRPPQTPLSLEKRSQAEKLLEQLSHQNKLHSLSAFVQVKLQIKGKNESFDAAILMSLPNKLRIEVLDDLGQVSSRIVADGSHVLYVDANAGEYALLDQETQALKKILHLPLSVEEFIFRMLLKFPSAEILSLEEPTVVERSVDQLRVNQGPLSLEAYAAKRDLNTKKFLYRVEYRQYQSKGSIYYPRDIKWSFEKPRVVMGLEMKDTDFNADFGEQKFDTSPPSGARLVKIH
jgi:outer membrane lipoprotein-sorting protein